MAYCYQYISPFVNLSVHYLYRISNVLIILYGFTNKACPPIPQNWQKGGFGTFACLIEMRLNLKTRIHKLIYSFEMEQVANHVFSLFGLSPQTPNFK